MRVSEVIFMVALMFSVAMAPADAQQRKLLSREAVDSLLNPTLYPESAKILSFAKRKENIGTIYESDAARVVNFAFRNVSDKSVTITKVTTHCGCTASNFKAEPVAPGDSSVVTITYNPKGRSGTIDADAFVYTDCSDKMPVARLTILGNVVNADEWSHLPFIAGTLRLKRKQVVFEKGRSEVRIPCANVGVAPLALKTLPLPNYVTFTTEPQVLLPGDEGDIIIAIDSDKVNGRQNFSVIIDGVGGKLSSRTIKAIIE